MPQSFLRLGAVVWIALLLISPVKAETTKPERIVNLGNHFAFTCEANSLIAYKAGENGFRCFHQPEVGLPDDSQYALLVFASGDLEVSTEALDEAGIKAVPGRGPTIATQADLDRVIAAEMELLKREMPGSARVALPDGKTVEVPYATWSKRVGAKTHYALSYVALHNRRFINVQVEANEPLSERQVEWLTSKLELLAVSVSTLPAPETT